MTVARSYPAGVTSWVDVQVDDVAAATAFYGGLFGWTTTQVTPAGQPTTYVVARLDGQDAAGLGGPATPTGSASGHWRTYIAVEDLDTAIAAAQDAGGRLVGPAEQAGEAGRGATIADPAGATVSLWQAGHRLGAQVANQPGAWNFSDLWARDPAASMPFYERVFGWEFTDVGFATMIRRPGYGDHLAATTDPGIHERQSAVAAPPGFADAIGWLNRADDEHPPGWHVTFTVADRDETVARVTTLGGAVVRQEDTEWTRTALVRDPQGAELTLSQFTPPGS